jgi:hypothetical protein
MKAILLALFLSLVGVGVLIGAASLYLRAGKTIAGAMGVIE